MNAKVQKWGNSLALRIPRSLARDADLTTGSVVDITVRDGRIVMDPHPGPAHSLEELLSGVTKKNIHSEIDTGAPVGTVLSLPPGSPRK